MTSTSIVGCRPVQYPFDCIDLRDPSRLGVDIKRANVTLSSVSSPDVFFSVFGFVESGPRTS